MANGLSFSSREPQLNVFATFAAFFEGIAREGFEFWRYQRNLTGANEGLNVIMHLSHVGACTGPRSLLGLEPRLDQPGARLPAVPAPLLRAGRRARGLRRRARRRRRPGRPHRGDPARQPAGAQPGRIGRRRSGTPATRGRRSPRTARTPEPRRPSSPWARRATSPARPPTAPPAQGVPADVYVVNGFPLEDGFLDGPRRPLPPHRDDRGRTHRRPAVGHARVRGAGGHAPGRERRARSRTSASADPRIAPSEHFVKVWEHFGITEDALLAAIM